MKFLLGLHDEGVAKFTVRILQRTGHESTLVTTLDEMVSGAESHGEGGHDFYIMDANLGYWNGNNCDSAQKVYDLLQKRVDGDVPFMSVTSGNAIHYAQEVGIPCIMKRDILAYLRTL